jgi:hypothetical protein
VPLRAFRHLWFAGALAAAVAAWLAAPAGAVPAAVVSYSATPAPAVDAYARPGNVIVVTMDLRVRDPARILSWRRKGAIVLAYVNAVDHPDRTLGPLETRLYGGGFPARWLYPGGASNWPGTRLLDLRQGSPKATYRGFTGTWGDYVARFIGREVLGDGRLFNGVFLDVWGDRVWNLGIGGRGSTWDRGTTRTSKAIRARVGSGVYLVANSSPSPAAARYLNGRMFESFEARGAGWNQFSGGGETPGLLGTMRWNWFGPRLMILWRNEGAPTTATKRMLNDAALAATRSGRDIAVGSSDHQYGIPAPFAVSRLTR